MSVTVSDIVQEGHKHSLCPALSLPICLISALTHKFLKGLHFALLIDRLSTPKRMSAFLTQSANAS